MLECSMPRSGPDGRSGRLVKSLWREPGVASNEKWLWVGGASWQHRAHAANTAQPAKKKFILRNRTLRILHCHWLDRMEEGSGELQHPAANGNLVGALALGWCADSVSC